MAKAERPAGASGATGGLRDGGGGSSGSTSGAG